MKTRFGPNLARLGRQKGPKMTPTWGPKTAQNVPQDCPKTLPRRSKTPKTALRRPQDTPKTSPGGPWSAPRRPPRAKNLGVKNDFLADPLKTSILERLGFPSGGILATCCARRAPKTRPRASQERPRHTQERAQEASKTAPRAPKRPPRLPQKRQCCCPAAFQIAKSKQTPLPTR